MKLIDEWHQAWRWFSVQIIAVAGAFQAAVLLFPAEMRAYLPEPVMHGIALTLLAAAVLGRLVDQKKA